MAVELTAKQARIIKTRIGIGERYSRKMLKSQMQRALRLYMGDHYKNMDSPSDVSRLVINYCMHVVETRRHSVAFRYPRFVLTPGSQEAEEKEVTTQAWIKHCWKVGYIQDELRSAKWDAEVYGTGVIQDGWLF